MTGALFRLGRLCVRHRWIVLAIWLLIFAALAIWARALGPNVSDNLTLPGTDSHAATDLLEKRFPSQANGMNPVVLRAPGGEKITASKFQTPIDDTSRHSRRTRPSAARPARWRATPMSCRRPSRSATSR